MFSHSNGQNVATLKTTLGTESILLLLKQQSEVLCVCVCVCFIVSLVDNGNVKTRLGGEPQMMQNMYSSNQKLLYGPRHFCFILFGAIMISNF